MYFIEVGVKRANYLTNSFKLPLQVKTISK